MKILFLSHYFPPEVNAPASRTFDHCREWARCGHDVTVVTCVPNCPDGVVFAGYRNRWRSQVEVMDGVRVVRVWTYVAANAGTIRRVLNYLSYMVSATLNALTLDRPDVVIATSPQFFCGWAGVFVARLKRAPFVLEIRDVWPEGIAAVGGLEGASSLLGFVRRLARWMYLAADYIVAVGDGYREHVLATADVEGRIAVITNGVDLRFFAPRPPNEDLARRFGLSGKFICSYVGTIGMAHRLSVVLEAARLLRDKGRDDIAFLLVGDGAERKALQAQAQADGLTDRVVFAGRQPKDLMPDILATSNACLVHLRRIELFTTVIPSKIFETMAMGRPIIMGVKGQARDFVMSAEAGIAMEPESAPDLVQAVERLADDAAFTAHLGRAARDYVARHFDRHKLAARYLDLLESIVGSAAVNPLASKEPAGGGRR